MHSVLRHNHVLTFLPHPLGRSLLLSGHAYSWRKGGGGNMAPDGGGARGSVCRYWPRVAIMRLPLGFPTVSLLLGFRSKAWTWFLPWSPRGRHLFSCCAVQSWGSTGLGHFFLPAFFSASFLIYYAKIRQYVVLPGSLSSSEGSVVCEKLSNRFLCEEKIAGVSM